MYLFVAVPNAFSHVFNCALARFLMLSLAPVCAMMVANRMSPSFKANCVAKTISLRDNATETGSLFFSFLSLLLSSSSSSSSKSIGCASISNAFSISARFKDLFNHLLRLCLRRNVSAAEPLCAPSSSFLYKSSRRSHNSIARFVLLAIRCRRLVLQPYSSSALLLLLLPSPLLFNNINAFANASQCTRQNSFTSSAETFKRHRGSVSFSVNASKHFKPFLIARAWNVIIALFASSSSKPSSSPSSPQTSSTGTTARSTIFDPSQNANLPDVPAHDPRNAFPPNACASTTSVASLLVV